MRSTAPAIIFLFLGCAGTGLEGSAFRAARGPWGAGGAEGPVKYIDWHMGASYSLKHWKDDCVDEDQWFTAYEATFVYHVGYLWDIEFYNWGGRFIHPRDWYKIQALVHILGLRYTRPLGMGWWHLSLGAGWCNNDNVDAHDTLGYRVAAGYTYPIIRPLSLSANVSYLWNETEALEEWGGGPVSLSVLSVGASVAMTF